MGNEPGIDCSEKTIRRELNTRGGLRAHYFDQIAKTINVYPKLLSGELMRRMREVNGDRKLHLLPLGNLDAYPYFRAEQEKHIREGMDETIKRVLSWYDISFEQFQEKDFEGQYEFKHDLLSAILPIITKHFDRNGYGDTDERNFAAVLAELESYRDTYYEELYADTTLRDDFLRNPPKGYSRKQIQNMIPRDLIGLDLAIQWEQYSEDDYLAD